MLLRYAFLLGLLTVAGAALAQTPGRIIVITPSDTIEVNMPRLAPDEDVELYLRALPEDGDLLGRRLPEGELRFRQAPDVYFRGRALPEREVRRYMTRPRAELYADSILMAPSKDSLRVLLRRFRGEEPSELPFDAPHRFRFFADSLASDSVDVLHLRRDLLTGRMPRIERRIVIERDSLLGDSMKVFIDEGPALHWREGEPRVFFHDGDGEVRLETAPRLRMRRALPEGSPRELHLDRVPRRAEERPDGVLVVPDGKGGTWIYVPPSED